MTKFLLFLIAICSLCLLNGCAAGNTTTTPPPIQATHFSVTSSNAAPVAGTAFTIIITALDASGQIATTYSGTVHFASTDTQAVLPGASMLTNGSGSFSATLKTAGPQTITATDANSHSGNSNSITVTAGAANRFSVTGPAAASAGVPFTFTLTAFDAYNNIATGYPGMVHFSSSDAHAVLPPDSTLANGTGTFPVTLKTVANATITATDTATVSLTGGSSPINVVSNAPTHLLVATLGAATARAPISVEIKALDAANNIAAGYSGIVHFSSTDAKAILPADSALANGIGTYSATLETAGNQIITTTDTVTASLTGASSSIAVSSAAALAISSGTPPSGAFGTIYGPITTENFKCTISGCTPCIPSSSCSSLPLCHRHPQYPCRSTTQARLGFPLTATGGVPPYSWSVSGLPPGLSFNSSDDDIFGTPTVPGNYNVSVSVTDSGTPKVTSPVSSYTLVVNDPAPPVISATPAPPAAGVNLPYTFTFSAASTAPPLMWRTSPSSGPLPPGLTLSQAGVLSGSPTAVGSSPITLLAEDSFKQDSAPQDFSIQIFAHGFKAMGSMANSRLQFTATLLSNGKVLVAGGIQGTGTNTKVLAEAELYDPATGSFSTTGSMGTARAYFAATMLCNLSSPPCNDNRVLVTGGIDVSGNPITTAELYDPTTGTFSPTTGSMQFVHASHTATLLNNGKVLVAGWGNAFAELFDPSTETFKQTGSILMARVSHTATLLNNGKVLITGGIQGVPPATTVMAEAELYDPTTGSFSVTLGSMATPRQWHTATLLTDGKVLVTGGADKNGIAFNTAELFDPANQSFAPTKGNMATARALQTATLLKDGTVLVTGGSGATPLATAELYDPIAGTFSPTGSMGAAREQHTATLLNDGTVLVTGGVNYTGDLATAELYQ